MVAGLVLGSDELSIAEVTEDSLTYARRAVPTLTYILSIMRATADRAPSLVEPEAIPRAVREAEAAPKGAALSRPTMRVQES